MRLRYNCNCQKNNEMTTKKVFRLFRKVSEGHDTLFVQCIGCGEIRKIRSGDTYLNAGPRKGSLTLEKVYELLYSNYSHYQKMREESLLKDAEDVRKRKSPVIG